jgi:hypothetical protein
MNEARQWLFLVFVPDLGHGVLVQERSLGALAQALKAAGLAANHEPARNPLRHLAARHPVPQTGVPRNGSGAVSASRNVAPPGRPRTGLRFHQTRRNATRARSLLARVLGTHTALRCLWADGGMPARWGTGGSGSVAVYCRPCGAPQRPGFHPAAAPVGARTHVRFGWVARRLQRDYQRRAGVAEGLVCLVMPRLKLRRWIK